MRLTRLGYWGDKSFFFSDSFTWPPSAAEVEVKISLVCDQDWAKQDTPKPHASAQTHFVRAKTLANYTAKSSEYTINTTSNLEFISEPFTKSTLLKGPSFKTTEHVTFDLAINLTSCLNSGSKAVGVIKATYAIRDSEIVLTFAGELNLPSNDEYEAHFYEFGDTSFCGEFVGRPLSPFETAKKLGDSIPG